MCWPNVEPSSRLAALLRRHHRPRTYISPGQCGLSTLRTGSPQTLQLGAQLTSKCPDMVHSPSARCASTTCSSFVHGGLSIIVTSTMLTISPPSIPEHVKPRTKNPLAFGVQDRLHHAASLAILQLMRDVRHGHGRGLGRSVRMLLASFMLLAAHVPELRYQKSTMKGTVMSALMSSRLLRSMGLLSIEPKSSHETRVKAGPTWQFLSA